MMAVSRAPLDAIQAYKRRMGWTFPWASSFDSDFNYDFEVSFTEEQQRGGRRSVQLPPRAAVAAPKPGGGRGRDRGGVGHRPGRHTRARRPG